MSNRYLKVNREVIKIGLLGENRSALTRTRGSFFKEHFFLN